MFLWFGAHTKLYVSPVTHLSHDHSVIVDNRLYPMGIQTSKMDSAPLPRWQRSDRSSLFTPGGTRQQQPTEQYGSYMSLYLTNE
jgi:hypothetical protein